MALLLKRVRRSHRSERLGTASAPVAGGGVAIATLVGGSAGHPQFCRVGSAPRNAVLLPCKSPLRRSDSRSSKQAGHLCLRRRHQNGFSNSHHPRQRCHPGLLAPLGEAFPAWPGAAVGRQQSVGRGSQAREIHLQVAAVQANIKPVIRMRRFASCVILQCPTHQMQLPPRSSFTPGHGHLCFDPTTCQHAGTCACQRKAHERESSYGCLCVCDSDGLLPRRCRGV